MLPAAPHHLKAVAKALDDPAPAAAAEQRDDRPDSRSDLPQPRTLEPGSNTPLAQPLRYVDVFVDDFIALVQGDERDRDWVRATILNKADQVFAPPGPGNDKHKEPISEKKHLKSMQYVGVYAVSKLEMAYLNGKHTATGETGVG